MTRQRNDNHSTEFGIWIRNQPCVDSYKGYRNYNLDIIWWRKNGFERKPEKWMLIEEKRHMAECKGDQKLTFEWLHEKLTQVNDGNYCGIHLLQFENTNPDDGKMYWDGKEITKQQLLNYLQFNFT